MRFRPKSESEIASENLLPAGVYPFVVAKAEDAVSQAGNEMLKLTLRVYDEGGGAHGVFDYLLESVAYKLRHFCQHVGLIAAYESGTLSARDCDGVEGYCKLGIDGRDKNYPPKNVVRDYVGGLDAAPAAARAPTGNPSAAQAATRTADRAETPAAAPAAGVAAATADTDDDIPF